MTARNIKLDPRLYILMRTDLDSMNPGKAVAQGTHAANHFQSTVQKLPKGNPFAELYKVWRESTPQFFGTCITLGCTERQMRKIIETTQHYGIPSGIIHDPTYPLLDGPTLHLLPLDTCAWVFGDNDELKLFLDQLELMK